MGSDNTHGCDTLQLLHILGKRWTIPVLEYFFSAMHSEIHFNTMQEELTGITPKILSNSLKDLHIAGIIQTKETEPGYFTYSLTNTGIAAEKLIKSIKEFGVCVYNIREGCPNRKCIECELFYKTV